MDERDEQTKAAVTREVSEGSGTRKGGPAATAVGLCKAQSLDDGAAAHEGN